MQEEIDDRIACPDGNCTGTIEAGVCRVCGLNAPGMGLPVRADSPPEADREDPAGTGLPELDPTDLDGSGAGDWDDREPCPDGNCIGTLEAGVCRVCGAA